MAREFERVLATLRLTTRRSKPIDGCLRGTRADEFSRIDRWLHDPWERNILWIKGHPGSGKTSIASTLVEKLTSQKNPRLGSSFFFERDNSDFIAPLVFWSQVAYDLAQIYPEFASAVVAVLKNRDINFDTTPVETQFRLLISEPLTDMATVPDPTRPRVVIVVDAVDECGGFGRDSAKHRRDLLATLKIWSKLDPRQFKLIVTSREEGSIPTNLGPIAAIIELDLTTVTATKDIQCYLKTELKRVVDEYVESGDDEENLHAWVTAALLSELTTRAGGLFVWAKTLITFLESGNPRDQLDLILEGEDMGRKGDINILYWKILKIAFYQNGPPKTALLEAFHGVVGTIVCSKRPLENSALTCSMELAGIKENAWMDLRRRLRSVMVNRSASLRFQHQSFVDFLTSRACPLDFRVTLDAQNERKKTITLAALNRLKDLRFNICRLQTSYIFNSTIPNLQALTERYIPTTLQYCCRYWADYLDTNHGDTEILAELQQFLRSKFLYWVEVLSLLTSADEPLLAFALDQLNSVIKWSLVSRTHVS